MTLERGPENEQRHTPRITEQRQALRAARDELRLSADFGERLERALIGAQAAPPKRGVLSWLRQWTELPLVLSAGLSVVVAVCVCWDTPVFDAFRVAEHSLDISTEGGAFVPLELALHHHGSEPAQIAVSAPKGLSMANPSGDRISPHSCHASRCSYALTGSSDESAPVHIKIDRPGRYRMEVEHRSSSAAVREVFVIHARR